MVQGKNSVLWGHRRSQATREGGGLEERVGRVTGKAGGAECKQEVNTGKGYTGVPCTITETFL